MISGLIALVLLAVLISNLPDSELEDRATPIVRPLLDLTALEQNWNLFAPDPRRSTLRLEARLTYADGTTVLWHAPDGDALLSPYRSYRWRKWYTNVLSDRRVQLWEPAARWIARTNERDGEAPVVVTLVRQFFFAPDQDTGETRRPAWREDVLYVLRTGETP